ncbi:glycosyltransferase [Caloramator sp. CAR-1]|uniref:glycosyltransferase n=1 Tax=Caloramator sp. CAR-1 TaxID=3062777 RepID=UPI0026E32631|nr:glycosyltransferase [Caloramator sp. CAR-1]MDO6355731.1 glycosyltransferase [Caloramator sp. CAR-1]
MKKIIYLFYTNLDEQDKSIIKKVYSQKKAFNQIGVEVRILTFGFKCNSSYKIGDDHIHITIDNKNIKNKFDKLLIVSKLIEKVIFYLNKEKPDLVYLRDCLYFFSLHKKISQIAPLFVEIQTNIFDELKLKNKLRYYLEYLLKRRYLKYANGLVCITKEISLIEGKFNKKDMYILGNGIDEKQIKFIRKRHNNFINLLFIGTPNLSWHGVDRLIKSYLNAPNKEKFKLHIVGYENIFGIDEKNIIFYGFIHKKEELEEIVAQSDIGIGTLALYRKHMNEAAPLKVRQYIANGLPVIIAYDDVDLNENLPFILKFPNDESLLDFNLIEEFYYRTKHLRESGEIIKYAYNLTWENKMKGFLEFAKLL